MYKNKKVLIIFACLSILNGCSFVGLDVDASVDKELTGDWQPVNSEEIKAYHDRY